jgi:nitrogen fixation-related uncharacterized protein
MNTLFMVIGIAAVVVLAVLWCFACYRYDALTEEHGDDS